MADEDKKTIDNTQEPEAPVIQAGQPKTSSPKRLDALSSVKSKIPEELIVNDIAAVRLIVERKYQLEDQVEKLEKYREDYYTEKENSSVKTEKLNSLNYKQIFSSIGGIVVGLGPFVWDKVGAEVGITTLVAGAIFLGVGLLKKT